MCTDEGAEERSPLSLSIYWILYSGALMAGHIERAVEFYSKARYASSFTLTASTQFGSLLSSTVSTWVISLIKPTPRSRLFCCPWRTTLASGRPPRKTYAPSAPRHKVRLDDLAHLARLICLSSSGIEQMRLLPHTRDGDLQAYRVPR
jgi:hypothetical protein